MEKLTVSPRVIFGVSGIQPRAEGDVKQATIGRVRWAAGVSIAKDCSG